MRSVLKEFIAPSMFESHYFVGGDVFLPVQLWITPAAVHLSHKVLLFLLIVWLSGKKLIPYFELVNFVVV